MDISVTTASHTITNRIERTSSATDFIVACVLFLIVFGSGLVHLESFPPLWFDEGWTVCAARTWVESGHYGCLLRGEPAPPALAAHFPMVASVAASFKLFGIGIWQARIVGLLYTYGAFLLLYVVACRIYSRPVAIATLALLILIPLKWSIHPLYIGRQVMGEMPMLCFLLAGYACYLRSDQRRWLAAAVACWSVAWMTKAQLAPFLVLSLAGAMVLGAVQRNRQTVRRLVMALIGSWAGYRLLLVVKDLLLAGHTIPHPPVPGMTEAIALVFVPSIRAETISYLLVSWPEYLIGLVYAAWRLRRKTDSGHGTTQEGTVRTMLLLLAGSWLAWFAFLCAGEPRYALPGLFIAAPFTAAFFHDFTGGFDLKFMRRALADLVRNKLVAGDGGKAAVVVILLCVMGWTASQERYSFRSRQDDRDLFAVTHYLNTTTSPAALIETYDSELFLFLNRLYTYAPPRILVEVFLHELDRTRAITYDPLAARPDYIVIGDFGRWAGFYKPLIEQDHVRLVKTIGRYQIYEPVRP